MWNVRKAAVIGAGVMGSAIAAHLANAGIPCLLLDLEGLAAKGLERLKDTRPSPLYDPSFQVRIKAGDLDRDLAELSECDWVIEAVSEKLDVKHSVWKRIDSVWKPGMIVSSNTSGLSINEIASVCGEECRRHAMVTHFFNPPRYMKLLEIVPCRDTVPEAVSSVARFCRDRLGKGVVIAKDTPNFIANRIGTYSILATLRAMEKHGLTVDEVDAVTGPLLGRPKSATFRTLDLVGLDTFLHVCRNVRESVTDPLEAEAFAAPAIIEELVSRGWLGEKSGCGFYRKNKEEKSKDRIQVLDLSTMDYRPRQRISSPALEAAKMASGISGKAQALLEAADRDRLAGFARDVLEATLCYSAEKLGEIADTVMEIDQAMRWGFNWEEGPFETWDALGVSATAVKLEERGIAVPVPVAAMLAKESETFYVRKAGSLFHYSQGHYKFVEERPEEISLRSLRDRGRTIFAADGARLIDVGDDVACLEFHSPHNAIGPGVLSAIRQASEEVDRNWRGLVLANEGRNFCVGANLMLLLMEAENGEWEEIDLIIREFQQSMKSLRVMPRPVVAAPHRMTLGGGVEACLPADRVLFSAETYFGLVETGVGLIPAGGGCMTAAVMAQERAEAAGIDDVTSPITQLFETIALAKISDSGYHAKRLGYWRAGDAAVIREESRIAEAKTAVLELDRRGYAVPDANRLVKVGGREAATVLKLAVSSMRRSGYITDHDVRIAGKLAVALTGGDLPAGAEVPEDYLLELEREAFLSLCAEPLTQARMRQMLATGKPLRN
ncbi:3-hydroxyacyl-CoA dehydrogenase/enoyl-CoA hydratase family protein [Cohnella lupini]|uniref:3-hydroxyacyl-CoA dehydrogenase n=1 Tax=Cohnella lupini TaxID=1294267 RepID=A0A3D9ISG9_9BACL|nr:3-hydroxyacyl-CoA dehydrogenase/enoyl-CoA hydratase family protein [Cohnella lupini]RED64702.1 3-hydroxyacyl-CoA dehydrogenase [Cohnella lupini]